MAWKYRWQWQQIVVGCRQSCINKYVQPRCTPELQNAFESMLDFIIASPSPVLHSSVGGCNEYACRTWKDTCPATIYRVQQRFKLCGYMCIQSPKHAFHRLLKGHDQNNSSLKRSAMKSTSGFDKETHQEFMSTTLVFRKATPLCLLARAEPFLKKLK
jgi:hypothetical protein